MPSTTVTYGDFEFSTGSGVFPPFVSQEFEAIGENSRFKQFNDSPTVKQGKDYRINFSLDGVISDTGIAGRSGEHFFSGLKNEGQFKSFSISDGSQTISFSNCYIENFSIPEGARNNNFLEYQISIIHVSGISGVIEPTNTESIDDSEDGTYTLKRELSAKGVGENAMQNAYNFVSALTGITKDQLGDVPYFNKDYKKQFILSSVEESIDRISSTYGVSMNYRGVTGAGKNDLVFVTKDLSFRSGFSDEKPSFDLSLTFKGDFTGTLTGTRNHANNYDYLGALQDFGYSGVLTSFNFNENSGANQIDGTLQFASGVTEEERTGYLDHSISMNHDEITDIRSYDISAQFVCYGTLKTKQGRLDSLKQQFVGQPIESYLRSGVTGSYLYSGFSGENRTLSIVPNSLTIRENSDKAEYSMSASFTDKDSFSGLMGTWQCAIKASKWLYNLQPTVNIPGVFILQDLNVKERERINLSVNLDSTGDYGGASSFASATGLEDILRSSYSDTNFKVTYETSKGQYPSDARSEYVLVDSYNTSDPTKFGDFLNNNSLGCP